MIPFAQIDPDFAKEQLVLLLREWYMHPNGEIPAYEFAFSDVNPPVHAWACWRVYKMTGPRGHRDRQFLSRACSRSCLLNFTWWVNRKDVGREAPLCRRLPGAGQHRHFRPFQAAAGRRAAGAGRRHGVDGLLLRRRCSRWPSNSRAPTPSYEDIASKFFEHFVAIADAMNSLGGTGLWDEQDGFYYDQLLVDGRTCPCGCGRSWGWCRCSRSRFWTTR